MTRPVHTEIGVVEEVKDGRVQIVGGFSWPGDIFPPDTKPGDQFVLQTVQASIPVTVAKVFFHKTEEDLENDRLEHRRKMYEDHERLLEEKRSEWIRREARLPQPLVDRLNNFREKAGIVTFNREGWGYELVISELAVLYSLSGGEDTEAVMDYARREGTSGNQHDYAKALARLLSEAPEKVSETIAGLAPLGVGAYYEKAGD